MGRGGWRICGCIRPLHLLCALLPGVAVTGGQIGAERSRLDVDLPGAPDREALEAGFAGLVAADHPVTTAWVEESVLDSHPELVRTLSVQPPRGTGRLRLVRIGAGAPPVDLQPCGGTHVGSTGMVGRVRVLKVENKGQSRTGGFRWGWRGDGAAGFDGVAGGAVGDAVGWWCSIAAFICRRRGRTRRRCLRSGGYRGRGSLILGWWRIRIRICRIWSPPPGCSRR